MFSFGNTYNESNNKTTGFDFVESNSGFKFGGTNNASSSNGFKFDNLKQPSAPTFTPSIFKKYSEGMQMVDMNGNVFTINAHQSVALNADHEMKRYQQFLHEQQIKALKQVEKDQEHKMKQIQNKWITKARTDSNNCDFDFFADNTHITEDTMDKKYKQQMYDEMKEVFCTQFVPQQIAYQQITIANAEQMKIQEQKNTMDLLTLQKQYIQQMQQLQLSLQQ